MALQEDCPLLDLPLELRQTIYNHLLPQRHTSHPFPGLAITSVTHRLPASSLLNIHPRLTDEILAHYYHLTTWKLIVPHAFNFFRVDSDLARLERSSVLRHMRKVEVVVFCDILLVKEQVCRRLRERQRRQRGPGVTTTPVPASDGGDTETGGEEELNLFCQEIAAKIRRAVQVLQGAKELREVTLSWIDTTQTHGWARKAELLAPLAALAAAGVRVSIGEVIGPDEEEGETGREVFLEAVREVLKGGKDARRNGPVSTMDGAMEIEPTKSLGAQRRSMGNPIHLSSTFFDPRQQQSADAYDWSARVGGLLAAA